MELPIFKKCFKLTDNTDDVTDVDINGNLVATASSDKTVRIYEFDNSGFKLLPVPDIDNLIHNHEYDVRGVRFSPLGNLLATWSTDGTCVLWSVNTFHKVWTIRHSSNNAIRCANFAPSGTSLVTGSDDEIICLWDVTSRSLKRSLHGHECQICACCFSPDSKYVVTGGSNGTLKLWQPRSGRCLAQKYEAHDMGVTGICFSSEFEMSTANKPGIYTMASCGNDDLIQVWQIRSGVHSTMQILHTLRGHGQTVNACRYSHDGKLLISCGIDKTIIIWNAETGQQIHLLRGHSGYVTNCAITPDNTVLISGSSDKSVIVWTRARRGSKNKLSRSTTVASTDTLPADPQPSNGISVKEWGVNEVSEWFANNSALKQYAELMLQSEIDGAALLGLTDEDLKLRLNISPLKERILLFRELDKLLEDSANSSSLLKRDTWIPEELRCPLTRRVFEEPVVLADGHTYEKAAIANWLESGNTESPMTDEPLEHTLLIPNCTLQVLAQRITQGKTSQ